MTIAWNHAGDFRIRAQGQRHVSQWTDGDDRNLVGIFAHDVANEFRSGVVHRLYSWLGKFHAGQAVHAVNMPRRRQAPHQRMAGARRHRDIPAFGNLQQPQRVG